MLIRFILWRVWKTFALIVSAELRIPCYQQKHISGKIMTGKNL